MLLLDFGTDVLIGRLLKSLMQLETIIHDFRDQKKRRDIKVGGALLPWALRVIGKLLRATTVDVPDTQRAIIDMLLCAVESLSSATQHAALETAFVVFECQGIDFAKHLAAKMAPRAADCLRRRCSGEKMAHIICSCSSAPLIWCILQPVKLSAPNMPSYPRRSSMMAPLLVRRCTYS